MITLERYGPIKREKYGYGGGPVRTTVPAETETGRAGKHSAA